MIDDNLERVYPSWLDGAGVPTPEAMARFDRRASMLELVSELCLYMPHEDAVIRAAAEHPEWLD